MEKDREGLPDSFKPDSILNQGAIFFGHAQGDMAGISEQVMTCMRIKDFANLNNLAV